MCQSTPVIFMVIYIQYIAARLYIAQLRIYTNNSISGFPTERPVRCGHAETRTSLGRLLARRDTRRCAHKEPCSILHTTEQLCYITQRRIYYSTPPPNEQIYTACRTIVHPAAPLKKQHRPPLRCCSSSIRRYVKQISCGCSTT